MSIAEVEEACEIVKAIVQGNGASIAEQNLRNADRIGSSSCGTDGADWDSWTGKVNLRQVTMFGHSLGAATTVEILRHSDRFQWVGQGIIYDLWGLSLKPSESVSGHHINVLLLGINSKLSCTGTTISVQPSGSVRRQSSMARWPGYLPLEAPFTSHNQISAFSISTLHH